jgi:hypothetical protein
MSFGPLGCSEMVTEFSNRVFILLAKSVVKDRSRYHAREVWHQYGPKGAGKFTGLTHCHSSVTVLGFKPTPFTLGGPILEIPISLNDV